MNPLIWDLLTRGPGETRPRVFDPLKHSISGSWAECRGLRAQGVQPRELGPNLGSATSQLCDCGKLPIQLVRSELDRAFEALRAGFGTE